MKPLRFVPLFSLGATHVRVVYPLALAQAL